LITDDLCTLFLYGEGDTSVECNTPGVKILEVDPLSTIEEPLDEEEWDGGDRKSESSRYEKLALSKIVFRLSSPGAKEYFLIAE
jgi:hypothetical protein